MALVFMHPSKGIPSPVARSPALETVGRLTGVHGAEVAKELEAMSGSLTLLAPGSEGDHWMFRHPTVGDAYADIVAQSPEKVELYVAGAHPDRLLVEVVCSADRPEGSKVRVPARLYPMLLRRLSTVPTKNYALMEFLTSRCEPEFLRALVEARPEIFEMASWINVPLDESMPYKLLAALHRAGCLPEETRRVAVARIDDATLHWMDVAVFRKAHLRDLLTQDEFSDLETRFRAEWVDDIRTSFEEWQSRFSVTDELSHYNDYRAAVTFLHPS